MKHTAHNLGAVGWTMSPEQLLKLDKASEVMPAYPYTLSHTGWVRTDQSALV